MISPNIVILTRDELDDRENKAFQRGLIEALNPDLHIARNCAHWRDGRCERCGAQWQGMEVSSDFACPHFEARRTVEGE